MRVLVADGDAPFLGILQTYLRDNGHEAEVAHDGLTCQAILREFSPEVLVLERELLWGGSDGILDLMRDDPEMCQTPVILISDPGDPLGRDHPADSPIVGRLHKPFRLSALLRELHAAASGRKSNRSNPRNGANAPLVRGPAFDAVAWGQ